MTSKYILIILWIGLCAIFIYSGRFYRVENVLGTRETRLVPWFAIVVFIPLLWTAIMRGYFADTAAYINMFKSMPENYSEIGSYMGDVTKDKAFYLFSCFFKVFVTKKVTVYLGVIAAIQSLAVITLYRKYSISYIVSVFLFVVSTDYISWMFNGMRQFLAVAIILFATPLMLKKKYIPLLIVILFAATFHLSALLMIPFVLLSQGKAWNKKTMIYIVLVVLAIVFIDRFTSFLDDSLAGTQYASVVSDYISWQDNGTNILRVLVYSIPAILAFFGRHYIDKSKDPLINFCTNMSIISAGLYLLSWATSGIFLGRLPIYASLYSYILLPWELENMFSYRSRRFVYLIMILAYFVFYYIQMHMIWGLF